MAFKDASEIIGAGMALPIRGKVYTIPPVSAEVGITLENIAKVAILATGKGHREPTEAELEALQLDDVAEKVHARTVLGPAYDEMVADGVDYEAIKLALRTATIWAVDSLEAAEKFWNAGGVVPKARKKPADRKRGAKSAPRASTGSKPRKKS